MYTYTFFFHANIQSSSRGNTERIDRRGSDKRQLMLNSTISQFMRNRVMDDHAVECIKTLLLQCPVGNNCAAIELTYYSYIFTRLQAVWTNKSERTW